MFFNRSNAPRLFVQVCDTSFFSSDWVDLVSLGDLISVDCKSGKQNELDDLVPGTATIVLDNTSGRYDPTWANNGIPATANLYPWPNFNQALYPSAELPTQRTGTFTTIPAWDTGVGAIRWVATTDGTVTWSTSAARTPVTPGQMYAFNGLYYANGALEGVYCGIRYYDAGGTFMSEVETTDRGRRDRPAWWCGLNQIFTPPTGAASAVPIIKWQKDPSSANTQIWIDEFRISPGQAVVRNAVSATDRLAAGNIVRIGMESPNALNQILPLWIGRIEDVIPEFSDGSTVTVTCIDFLGDLANAFMDLAGRIFPTTLGATFLQLCNNVWIIDPFSSVGLTGTPLAAMVFTSQRHGYIDASNGNVLEMVNQLLRTGIGTVWMTGDGRAVAIFYTTPLADWASMGVQVAFNDDETSGTTLYTALETSSGLSKVRNHFKLSTDSTTSGGAAIAEAERYDGTSISDYLRRTQDWSTYCENAAGMNTLGDTLVARYKDKRLTIDKVSASMIGQSNTSIHNVAGARMWLKARVTRHYAGGARTLEQDSLIMGVEHHFTHESWTVDVYLQRPFE